MRVKFFLSLIITITYTIGFCQDVKFTELGESKSKSGLDECIYRLELFNNTNSPICIPVSLSFGFTVNLNDTVEVKNIYPANDSSVTFSLYYTKSELEGSSVRYPAVPVLINPNTYVLTNVRFEKIKEKKMFLELKCSYDKNLDYYKIRSSFENEPKYKWMDKLSFVDKKYPIY
ncbi:MAG: hypothetical protein N2747_10050 [Chitinophagaceae bacterium]|nr:hypothetical protein [Chitinophagaceae bacterium]